MDGYKKLQKLFLLVPSFLYVKYMIMIYIYFLRIHTLTKLSYYDIDEIQSAVVDLGTSQCRFGSAGQDLPRHVFRTVSGCDIHDL